MKKTLKDTGGELEEARHASNEIGINLHEEKINFYNFKEIFDNYAHYQDDLVGDEVGIPLYFLGKSSMSSRLKLF